MRYFIFIFCFCFNTYAKGKYKYLRESAKCAFIIRNYEYKYKIPHKTLSSIAMQESGFKPQGFEKKIVWPWAVNVEGKSHYFQSKNEAVAFTKQQLRLGRNSIDVGCMQINLKHHPDAFSSIENAFDPHKNVDYGASFLRSNYDKLGNWHKAISYYHSADPIKGLKYRNSVLKFFDAEKKIALKNSRKFRSNIMLRIPNKAI